MFVCPSNYWQIYSKIDPYLPVLLFPVKTCIKCQNNRFWLLENRIFWVKNCLGYIFYKSWDSGLVWIDWSKSLFIWRATIPFLLHIVQPNGLKSILLNHGERLRETCSCSKKEKILDFTKCCLRQGAGSWTKWIAANNQLTRLDLFLTIHFQLQFTCE